MSPQTKTFNEFLDWLGEHSDCDVFKRDFKEMVSDETPKKDELMTEIANMPCPTAVKDVLVSDLTFRRAVDTLLEKEKTLESKEAIDNLTKAVLKLCK